jgi:hypothetical protein
MADEIYQMEEWIDGEWCSLGCAKRRWQGRVWQARRPRRGLGVEDGTLMHAIDMVTSVHKISGNPVKILKRSGVKIETVFYKGKENPNGTEG